MATTAQVMAATLKELGVKYIFGVPSGNWVDYMDAVQETQGLEFILVSCESSAGFMADVCWRLTGTVAACFGTFGPGACNLTTGVCGGYLDRSPMLAFSDEKSEKMRNRVSQMSIDHQALFAPVTKLTTRLEPGRVKKILYNAFNTAVSEVPGPVHIGLPSDIGLCISDEEQERFKVFDTEPTLPEAQLIETMEKVFSKAQMPVAALGITSVRSRVQDLILKIIEKFKIPVVLTPMAKGMIPEDHPCYAGVLAHALSDQVSKIYQQADLVVGIGFDPVELNYEEWMPQKIPLLHIDTVYADIDRELYPECFEVVGSLTDSLEKLLSLDCREKQWDLAQLSRHREKLFNRLTTPREDFGPISVLNTLRSFLPKDGIMTCDVGAHLHLIGQHWKSWSPECQLMTNGCSSMGFAMPAAVAAKLSCPERQVCCVVGDGGFYMTAGEIATARRLNLNIVFVVIKDRYLSLIKIKQEKKGYGCYGTLLQNENKNKESTGSMFEVPCFCAENLKQYSQALKKAFEADSPVIVEAFVNADEYDELVLRGNG